MYSARSTLIVLLAAMLLASGAVPVQAAQGSGKIYCWKNKSGKTECGDSIPYEYQDAAIRELNKRGVTVKQTDAALTPEQRRLQEADLERKQAEEQKREDQRRRDKALLDTFSNEKEIDMKRGRDVQLIESNIETLQGNLKNMGERQADAKARSEAYLKDKRPVPQPIQDEIARLNNDRMQTERQIAQKRKEILALHQHYDDLKKRFVELTSAAYNPKKSSEQKSR